MIEPKDKEILSITLSKERNVFVVDAHFLSNLLKKYGMHRISTDDGGTWYPLQAYTFLKINHHIYFSLEKSVTI